MGKTACVHRKTDFRFTAMVMSKSSSVRSSDYWTIGRMRVVLPIGRAPISPVLAANAASMAVYQTTRSAWSFSYSIPGLNPGATSSCRPPRGNSD